MSHTTPLVFMHLLANQKLNPGAVLLRFGSFNGDSSFPWEEPVYSNFASQLPNFILASEQANFSEDFWTLLQSAGCHVLDDELLLRSDAQTRPLYPHTDQWLIGKWYFAPPAKPLGSQAASRARALKILQLVTADAESRLIEEVLRQDATLSYHLLRLVNCLGVAAGRKVTSFAQMIMILGRQQLRRWLNLMLFASQRDDYRTGMLFARVLIRARSMELFCKTSGGTHAQQELAFMAGMFSLLGVLFGAPLEDLLKDLPLSDELVEALLRHHGRLGELLALVEYSEAANLPEVSRLLEKLEIPEEIFNAISLETHQWMLGVLFDTPGAGHA